MTEMEWLKMGYQNKIIDSVSLISVKTFGNCYDIWFKSRLGKIKPQSLDRIEVTYRKYYSDSSFVFSNVDKIDEHSIIQFLNNVIASYKVNHKEFARIYQIVNNVMNYAHDFEISGARLIDWAKVKRCCNVNSLERNERMEYIVSDSDRQCLFDGVMNYVYSEKQNACYCLLLNFYLGLRIGELAALKFSDFDLTNNTVTIRRTEVKFYKRDVDGFRIDSMHYQVADSLKTLNSYRVLPLLPEAKVIYMMIKAWHMNKGYSTEYLCYDGSATIPSRSITRTLTRLCKLLEIRHINTHLIRKTYASLLHQRNIPTKVISDLMGHSDMETTERSYILNYEAGYERYRSEIEKALCLPEDPGKARDGNRTREPYPH